MRKITVALAAVALLSACTTTDTVLRPEGVTSFAGSAIAANTAMQIVDPWQYGVQNTNLKTPADRGSASQPAGEAASNSETTP